MARRLLKVEQKNPASLVGYDLLASYTYNAQHLPLTSTDAAGQTTTYTYNDRGQVLTQTNAKNETTTYIYDVNGHLISVNGPLPGSSIAFTYKRTDPLSRATLFQWCKCGALKSLTDTMGRTTTWRHDIQGRVVTKKYADGSKVTYHYENTISRLRQRIDEKLQVTQYDYNRDDTVSRIAYNNATVATPPVAFTYDANYSRLRSMTDGTGMTRYGYIPIDAALSLGAGQLASVDGPLPDDTITFSYDELGRRVSTAINGVAASDTYDAAGRIIASANALGVFNNTYDGNSLRKTSQSYPNGQTAEFGYAGNLQDQHLKSITNKLGITPISEFIYGRDVPTGQITSWSQQAGAQLPSIYSLAYDPVDQLISASVSEDGNVVKTFGYSYDPASNRLTEQVDATTRQFAYNALNELTSVEGDAGLGATYQWDAEHRLISITSGNQETQFTYDGLGRFVGIRQLVAGTEVSNRRFVWCDNEICEERTSAGIVSKRFFLQGMKVESGATPGAYFYSHDHLRSTRELIDSGGNVRVSYSYDPFGRRTRLTGDLDANFGFASMFWTPEASLNLTWFRAYDANIGRWLSRDSVANAELFQGPNLYVYVRNIPVQRVDLLGLACCETEAQAVTDAAILAGLSCAAACAAASGTCYGASLTVPDPRAKIIICTAATVAAALTCAAAAYPILVAQRKLDECLAGPTCKPIPAPPRCITIPVQVM